MGIESQALLSVRIVSMDYYLSKPVHELDVAYSNFRSSSIKKVPVIRVFGSTLAGQKVCLHLHGIFPYIYVPVPAQAAEGFVYRFCSKLTVLTNGILNCRLFLLNRLAASIDKALNIGLAAGATTTTLQPETDALETNTQHVFKVQFKSLPSCHGFMSKKWI
jgi:hypothetical protein